MGEDNDNVVEQGVLQLRNKDSSHAAGTTDCKRDSCPKGTRCSLLKGEYLPLHSQVVL